MLMLKNISLLLYTPIDCSFCYSNLASALEPLPDSEWEEFGRWMDVPESKLNEIESQFTSDKKRKVEVIRVIATEHPYPTWEHVADVLYYINEGGYHNVLENVQTKFPNGE